MSLRSPRPFLQQRGPGYWLRVLAYFVVMIGLQGVLSRWLEPAGWMAPDLFLLTGVALAWRLQPTRALLAAYGVGFLQDVLGGGLLGFHAAGIAGGVLLVLLIKRYLAPQGPFQAVVTVLAATAGQWLAFAVLSYWQRNGQLNLTVFQRMVPAVLVMTLLVHPLWERLVVWALGPRPNPEDGLG